MTSAEYLASLSEAEKNKFNALPASTQAYLLNALDNSGGEFPDPDVLFSTDEEWRAFMAMPLMEKWFQACKQLYGGGPQQSAGILDDAASPFRSFVVLDTEGQAPQDDLVILNTGQCHDGMVVELRAASPDRVITVRNTGNIYGITLAEGADKILSATEWLKLRREGDYWREVVAASGAVATPEQNGLVAAGGLPGQVLRTSDDGSAYEWGSLSGVLSGLVFPFSGALGGENNKHPIDRKTGQPDLAYALCDGGTYTAPDGAQVTTPDLRGRFILGPSADLSDVDTTGGAAIATTDSAGAHTHTGGAVGATTLTEAQMPAHTHTVGLGSGAQGSKGYTSPGQGNLVSSSTGGGASHTHTAGATGSAGEHTHNSSNMPPFYVLAYIMKL